MEQQHRSRTVVVGVDGSQSPLRAGRWSAPETVDRGVPARLVTAFAASAGAWLSAAASMVVGLVAGLLLAVVCALLAVALGIVTSLGRAAQNGVERMQSYRR